MKLAHIPFVFRRVFKSLRELLWTHILTSGTMAMTLFIFGGFLLIQENLHSLLKGWGSQIQIFAYLENRLSPGAVQPLLERVRSYPEVEAVRLVSQGEAWENFKRSLGTQSGILEGLSADILPASLEIALKAADRNHPSLTGVAQRLRSEKGVTEVEYPEEWMERFSLVLLGVQGAKWFLGGFLIIATLLIVGNTAKLAILARKDEIEIMQLVGASGGLIKTPFVIEGMIQGVLGASLSLLFLWSLFLFLSTQLPSSLGIFTEPAQLRFLDPESILLLLFLGWAVGAMGSLVSLRRFLKTW